MKAKANYVGKRFGLLKVIDCVEASTGTNKGGQWLCMCKCRRTVTLGGYQLHSRNSCGCLGRKAAIERGKLLRKPSRQLLYTELYARYKKECKYREEVPMYKPQWIELAESPCEYCGCKDTGTVLNYVIDEHTRCYQCKDVGKSIHSIFIEHIQKIHQYLSKEQP